MDTKTIILIIPMIVCNMDFISAANVCKTFKIKIKHLNTRLMFHALGEIIVAGHHQCARECMSLKECKSMDYYSEENKCKLNDVDSISVDSAEFEHKSGSVFSDITEWPSEMFGECSSRPCSGKQKCYSTYGKYTCIDIDCGRSIDIPDGTLVLETEGKHLFRDTAIVMCPTGYRTTKENVSCTMTGKWETSSCQRVINVALGKVISSSSIYKSLPGNYIVDGYTDAMFHTEFEQSPWIRIDLGSLYVILNVTVYNRWDCCQRTTDGLELKVGSTLDSMEVKGWIKSFPELMRAYSLNENNVARYVELSLSTLNQLVVSEVEVYGVPA